MTKTMTRRAFCRSATAVAAAAATISNVAFAEPLNPLDDIEHVVKEMERFGYAPTLEVHNNKPAMWGYYFPIEHIPDWPERCNYLSAYHMLCDGAQRDHAIAFMISTGRARYSYSKPARFDAEAFIRETEAEGYRYELTKPDRYGWRHYIEWMPEHLKYGVNSGHSPNYRRWASVMNWKTRDDAQAIVALLERRVS